MGGGQEGDSPLTRWKKWKIPPIKRSESVSSQGCKAACLWLCSETLKLTFFFLSLLESREAVSYLHPSWTEEWVITLISPHSPRAASEALGSITAPGQVGEAAQGQPCRSRPTSACWAAVIHTQEILLQHSLYLLGHFLNLGHTIKDLRTLQEVFVFKGSFG